MFSSWTAGSADVDDSTFAFLGVRGRMHYACPDAWRDRIFKLTTVAVESVQRHYEIEEELDDQLVVYTVSSRR